MFRALPKQMAADVFSNLDSDLQQVILESATDGELKQIMMNCMSTMRSTCLKSCLPMS